jgi:putative DNA primase/helicase
MTARQLKPRHTDLKARRVKKRAKVPTGDKVPRITLTKASDFQATAMSWLWPGRIPLRMVSILAGDGGCGKSTIVLDVAARVSTGAMWPDKSGSAPKGQVAVLNGEDPPSQVTRPRLAAAEADMSNVLILDDVNLSRLAGHSAQDFARLLRPFLEDNPRIKLLVIDPITAFLDASKLQREDGARAMMNCLSNLAEEFDVAIVIVAHTTKSLGSNGAARVAGSSGLVNRCRMALAVGLDPEDPSRSVMVKLKGNYTDVNSGIAFRLTNSPEHKTAKIQWLEDGVECDSAGVLAAKSMPTGTGEKKSAVDAASNFITQVLSHGPVPSTVAKGVAKEAGISGSSLRRAREALQVETYPRVTVDGTAWWWKLPDDFDHSQVKQDKRLDKLLKLLKLLKSNDWQPLDNRADWNEGETTECRHELGEPLPQVPINQADTQAEPLAPSNDDDDTYDESDFFADVDDF